MQSERVAVEPVSRPDIYCAYCAKPLLTFESRHVCQGCGLPQPLRSDEDFFTGFDVSKKFIQDSALLEKKFYSLSRVLHPDRFSTASAEARKQSLERMSWVNDAYRTLKDPEQIRDYILSVQPGLTRSNGLPHALAEDWFQIQDRAIENPANAPAELGAFAKRVDFELRELNRRIQACEEDFDQTGSQSALSELDLLLSHQNYLRSLVRNIDRFRQNQQSQRGVQG